mmetsp:Transcript_56873/g.179935  ORF Transcript_56873/g.179935 Transcript_56873/m.179935 type:complete len:312 (+) Transcript_56873:425-1360(+)
MLVRSCFLRSRCQIPHESPVIISPLAKYSKHCAAIFMLPRNITMVDCFTPEAAHGGGGGRRGSRAGPRPRDRPSRHRTTRPAAPPWGTLRWQRSHPPRRGRCSHQRPRRPRPGRLRSLLGRHPCTRLGQRLARTGRRRMSILPRHSLHPGGRVHASSRRHGSRRGLRRGRRSRRPGRPCPGRPRRTPVARDHTLRSLRTRTRCHRAQRAGRSPRTEAGRGTRMDRPRPRRSQGGGSRAGLPRAGRRRGRRTRGGHHTGRPPREEGRAAGGGRRTRRPPRAGRTRRRAAGSPSAGRGRAGPHSPHRGEGGRV